MIKGYFNEHCDGFTLGGWIAEIGNNNPLTAIILIDEEKFEIKADLYRSDLKKANINEGNHGFRFKIPNFYLDGQTHTLKLLSPNGTVLDTFDERWKNEKDISFNNDLSNYFSQAIVNPILDFPLSDQEKKILATMDDISKYLSLSCDQKSLVSVIMPVYNRENYILDAVFSVLNQTYSNFELIVIDDCSTDSTVDKVINIGDKRIKIILNHENLGVSKSRNIGLKASKGEYIMYLDSDNDWDPRYMATMVGAFKLLPNADALYSGQYLYEDNKENLVSIRFMPFNQSLLTNRNYIDLNAFCHKKSLFEEYGGFDEDLIKLVDWDLILKYSLYGTIYSVPVVLSNYYFNLGDTITNSILEDFSDIVIEKHNNRLKEKNQTLEFTLAKGVSIIIPNFESLEDLKICVKSILNIDDYEKIELIIVDNNSSKEVKDYLKSLEKDFNITIIFNDENYGFTYAINQGIEISNKKNDILIFNNDAFLKKGSLFYLQKAAYELENCGMTVPNQILAPLNATIRTHVPFSNIERYCDVNLSAYHKNVINLPLFFDGKYVEVNFAPFFCVYIKRDVYEKSFGLNAEYGRHYRSDVIYCNFIRHLLGYKIYYVSDALVYHGLQKATSELLENTKEYDILFRLNRWSDSLKKKLGFKTAKWDLTKEEYFSKK